MVGADSNILGFGRGTYSTKEDANRRLLGLSSDVAEVKPVAARFDVSIKKVVEWFYFVYFRRFVYLRYSMLQT